MCLSCWRRGNVRYDAGEVHGRQDAKKGVRFKRFPPVLTIHLKRFEYDMVTGNMVKVNDRFAFPRRMNIDGYLDEVRWSIFEVKSARLNMPVAGVRSCLQA